MKHLIFILLLAAQIASAQALQIALPVPQEELLAESDSSKASLVLAARDDPHAALYPYGYSSPVLQCAPLRVCLIELAAGERIVNPPIAGDNARWMIDYAYQGERPLVLVKPAASGVTTNLIITTDKRIYDVTLDSPALTENSTNPYLPYTRRVRFYYPDEMASEEVFTRSSEPLPARIEELNFDYAWKRGKAFPWAPVQVFDDGRHVYIKLPEEADELPPLYAEGASGREVINFRVENQTFITDRLFEKAVFVLARKKGRRFQEVKLTVEKQ